LFSKRQLLNQVLIRDSSHENVFSGAHLAIYIYEFVLVCWFEPKLDVIIVYKKSYASWISLLLSSQEEKVNLAESLICRIFGISFMVDK
jgi:hypothetical protein